MLDSIVKDAFHLMWGNFPEPVMLVHKNREILAINEVCKKLGGAEGIKCTSLGTPEQHKGCLANTALASGQATYVKNESNGKSVIAYWVPLADQSDIYVHFGVGTTIDYDQYS